MTKLVNLKQSLFAMCKFQLIIGPRTISTQVCAPSAIDCGPYSPAVAKQMKGSDVLYAGFACEPYRRSGLQLRQHDDRAIQALQTVQVMQTVLPPGCLGKCHQVLYG